VVVESLQNLGEFALVPQNMGKCMKMFQNYGICLENIKKEKKRFAFYLVYFLLALYLRQM